MAFAMLILYSPSGSGSSNTKPHFLLSELLKHDVPLGAEWVFVSTLSLVALAGSCLAAASHLKGDDADDEYVL